jgi:hypothetical protein
MSPDLLLCGAALSDSATRQTHCFIAVQCRYLHVTDAKFVEDVANATCHRTCCAPNRRHDLRSERVFVDIQSFCFALAHTLAFFFQSFCEALLQQSRAHTKSSAQIARTKMFGVTVTMLMFRVYASHLSAYTRREATQLMFDQQSLHQCFRCHIELIADLGHYSAHTNERKQQFATSRCFRSLSFSARKISNVFNVAPSIFFVISIRIVREWRRHTQKKGHVQ